MSSIQPHIESAAPVAGDDPLTRKIIGAAITVHKKLGPGLLESAYETCLCIEIRKSGLTFARQVEIPILYDGEPISCTFRVDLLIEDSVIVELKAVEHVSPVHHAQLLTYMKLARKRIGLLLNFNAPYLRDGIKRLIL